MLCVGEQIRAGPKGGLQKLSLTTANSQSTRKQHIGPHSARNRILPTTRELERGALEGITAPAYTLIPAWGESEPPLDARAPDIVRWKPCVVFSRFSDY